MGHAGSKTRSPGQILGNSCLHSRGNNCDSILMKLCQNMDMDMDYVGSKTRSPGQILGNSYLHSRGHICNLILMKLGQNVCLDNI